MAMQFEISASVSGSFKTDDTLQVSFDAGGGHSGTSTKIYVYTHDDSGSTYPSPAGNGAEATLINGNNFFIGSSYGNKSFTAPFERDCEIVQVLITGSMGNRQNVLGEPEGNLKFDNFEISVHQAKVEVTDKGILAFSSPSRYFKVDKSGLELKGGAVEAQSVRVQDLEVYGSTNIFTDLTIIGDGLQPYSSSMIDIASGSGGGDEGLTPQYARGDHSHGLKASTVANVIQDYELQRITASSALVKGDMFVSGTIEAIDLIVTKISSSVVEITGSNVFGDSASQDVHEFTGSVLVSGSEHTFFGSNVNISASDKVIIQNTLYASSSDKVGIGTADPAYTLEVKASANDDGILLRAANGQLLALLHQQNTDAGMFRLYDASSTEKIIFNADANQSSYINNGGNFGINTTNPSRALTVQGDISASQRIYTGDGTEALPSIAFGLPGQVDTGLYRRADGAIGFSAGGDAMAVLGTTGLAIGGTYAGNNTQPSANGLLVQGRVGIGTTAPSKKLEVEGDISASGFISTISNITASGFISASGDGNHWLGGKLNLYSSTPGNQEIKFGGAARIQGNDTYIILDSDNQFVARADNNMNFSTPVFGLGAFDTNDTAGAVLHISGVNATNETLIVEGSDGTDYLTVGLGGHITASGNISASGTITAEHIESTDDMTVADRLTVSGITNLQQTNFGGGYGATGVTITAAGLLQVDGDISGSATTTGSFGYSLVDDKIGVGTKTPLAKLHIEAGDSGFGSADLLSGGAGGVVIEDSDSAILTLVGGTSNDQVIAFGDSDSANVGRLAYSNTKDSMEVWTGGSKRAEFDDYGVNIIGDVSASGRIIAQEYVVSSSVINQTNVNMSGSSKFGDTDDDIHQFTGSLDVSGSLYVQSGSSKVGIGTTSPGSVLPNLFFATTPRLLEISSSTTSTDTGLFLRRSDNATGLDIWNDGSNGHSYIDNRYNATNGRLDFRVNTSATPATVMTITGDEKVGIGTTSPSSLLHLSSDSQYELKFEYTGQETFKLVHGTSGLYFTGPDTSTLLAGVDQNHDFKVFDTSGDAYATFDGSTAKVGIGTTSPNELVSIGNSTRIYNTYLEIESSGSGFTAAGIKLKTHKGTNRPSGMYMTNVPNNDTFYAGRIYGLSKTWGIGYSDNGQIEQVADEVSASLVVKSDGNVGIGTTNPTVPLQVTGDISASGTIHTDTISILTESDTFTLSGTNSAIIKVEATAPTSLLYLDANARVGINKADPTKTLEVAGDISASGDLYLNNTKEIFFQSAEGTWHHQSGSIRKNSGGGLRIGNNESTIIDLFGGGNSFLVANHDGKTQFQVTETGNVKIWSGSLVIGDNTIASGMELTVKGDISASGVVYLEDTIDMTNNKAIRWNNGGNFSSIRGEGNHLKYIAYGSGDHIFRSNTSDELVIFDNSGKVGIGTTNPTYELDVVGDIGVSQYIHHNDNDDTLINFQTDKIELHTGGNIGIVVDSSQRVGIGKSTAAYKLDVEGDAAFKDSIGTSSFASGFAGYGWRISNAVEDQPTSGSSGWGLSLDNLTVRGQMKVYELLIQQLRATNGSVWISSTGKVNAVTELTSPSYSLQFDTGSNTYGHGFREGDLIRAQRYQGGASSDVVFRSDLIVVSVGDSGSLTAITSSTGNTPPSGGFDYVRIGNITSASRQGSVYLTSDDDNAPYIDVIDGVTAHSDFNTSNNIKARLGKLNGISDSTFGNLSGYGLYSQNVYLTGGIKATFGEIGGFGISATTLSASDQSFVVDSSNKSIRLGENATDMTLISSSGIFMSGSGEFRVGNPDSDQFRFVNGNLEITASQINLSGSGVGINTSTFELDSDGLDISATNKSIDLGDGKIILSGSTVPVVKIDGGEISASNFFVSTQGQMTASAGLIGGFEIDINNLKSTDENIILNSNSKKFSIGSSTFGGHGVQFEYNGGAPKLHIGRNGHSGIRFEGSALSITSSKVDISGSDVNIQSPSFFLGSATNFISSSNNGLEIKTGEATLSGSSVDILTNNFFLGSATSFISGSSNGLELSSSEFNLNTTNLTIDSANEKIDLGGEIVLQAGNDPKFTISGSAGNETIKLEQSAGTSLFSFVKANHSDNTSGLFLTAEEDGEFKFWLGSNTKYLKFNNTDGLDILTDNATLSGSNIEILTPKFFFGDKNTSFISSSTSQIEISASAFHLQNNGQLTGSEVLFTGGKIANWTITNSQFKVGDFPNQEISLDASNKRITINTASFGDDGIQLEYNGGNPRAYIGDGTSGLKFDGTNLQVSGTNVDLSTPSFELGDATTQISGSGGKINIIGNVTMSNSVLIDGGLQVGNLPELPTEENLMTYYSFNGGLSGSTVGTPILDNSGNGRNTTGITGTPKFANGIFGNAVLFQSESLDFIKIDNADFDFGRNDSFTLSVWAKRFHPNTGSADPLADPDGDGHNSNAQAILTKGSYNFSYGIDYRHDINAVRVGVRDQNDNTNTAEFVMSDDLLEWHNIVMTYTSASTIDLYIDGELKVSTAIDHPDDFYSTGDDLEIGGNNVLGGNSSYYNGYIDEVRVYTGSLSAQQVRALYLNPGGIGTTNISGDEISTGKIQSNTYSATEGTELDLDNATFKLGGSSNPELSWDGTNLRVSGSTTEFITPNFFFGSTTNNISSSADDISITTKNLTASGSSVDILTPNFFLGSDNSFVSGSSNGVQISGSNIDLQTPSVFLGQGTTNFMSASGGSIEISSSNFHLKNGNITASNVDLSGKISATSGDIGGFNIGVSQINDDNSDLVLKDDGSITGSKVLFDGGSIGGFDINNDKIIGTAPASLFSGFEVSSVSSSVNLLGSQIVLNNDVGFGVIQASFGQTKRINTFEGKTGIDIGITNGSDIYKPLLTINETTQSIGKWNITDDALFSGNIYLSGSQEVLLVKDLNNNNVVVVGVEDLSPVTASTDNLFVNPGFEEDSNFDISPDGYGFTLTGATNGADEFPSHGAMSTRAIGLFVTSSNAQSGTKHFRVTVLASTSSQAIN